jgi:hypothetical protein
VAGSIKISDQLTWFTGGWGWGQLLDQAVRVATPDYRDRLAQYNTMPGLTLSRQPEQDRLPVAEILLRAAQDLVAKYEHGPDEYERQYAESLRELVAMLNEEIANLRTSG